MKKELKLYENAYIKLKHGNIDIKYWDKRIFVYYSGHYYEMN